MVTIGRALSKTKFRNFTVNYSNTHRTFFQPRIIDDVFHPLYIKMKRRHAQRERIGLWWYVTSAPDSSKTRVVRSWVYRRLQTAFIEDLKKRGIDVHGNISKSREGYRHKGVLKEILDRGETARLNGSLRLHCLKPIVTAKFKDVKEETSKVVDLLLDDLETQLSRKDGEEAKRKHQLESQWGRVRMPQVLAPVHLKRKGPAAKNTWNKLSK